jgi:Fanconi anemia group M protein
MQTSDHRIGLEHPLLASDVLERREYQLALADRAIEDHTLVCLPTGLGKTTVSLLVTAHRLEAVGGKSLLLAPTKPLVEQHATFYREVLQLHDDAIVVFTGEVSPEDRAELWDEARVVVATPQVVENDLIGNRISLSDTTHCTFDECHRGTGDYAYTYIAERYHADAEDPLVTGMSASPGGDEEAILTVCENLSIRSVEVMTEDDADVAEYTHDTDVDWETIELPEELLGIRDAINDVIEQRLETLRELGITKKTSPDLSQKELNRMRGQLQELLDNDQSEGYEGMSVHAELMKLRRAVELVETQSVEALERYFERLRQAARSSGASKADQRLVSDPTIKEAMRQAADYDELHPKFRRARIRLAEALGIEGGERAIVFTESRDTAEVLTEFFSKHFETRKFVGQSDTETSEGMTQTEQTETLDAFRDGEFEVLVSTSVAEEGLDVPEVDLVLFYEPVPTAIRSIQRKGRTGRQAQGAVTVLMAEDTRDEAYFWISRRREQEMEDELRTLKAARDDIVAELPEDDDPGSSGDDQQPGLDAFADEQVEDDASTAPSQNTESTPDQEEPAQDTNVDGDTTGDPESADDDATDDGVIAEPAPGDEDVEIVIDQRELDSTIARELSKREGIETRLETLAVGDYILSDRVAVERKTVEDFLDTLLGGDRSLFEQLGDLTRNYSRSILVLEGENLYERRDVHPEAIRGAVASLVVDFGVSLIETDDDEETMALLETIATREQEEDDREVSVHGEKQSKTLVEQQEYVVSSIADIGPVTARSLLAHCGSVEAVMTADTETLQEAEGVGEVTADRIREVVGSGYTGE